MMVTADDIAALIDAPADILMDAMEEYGLRFDRATMKSEHIEYLGDRWHWEKYCLVRDYLVNALQLDALQNEIDNSTAVWARGMRIK